MKITFETSRQKAESAAPAPVVTGLALRSPYSPEALRVRAEDIRGIQEFRHHAVELAEKMNRSYAAAASDGYTADFKGTYGSANSEIYPAKYSVRARTRTLAKDTTHGKGMMRVYADNVVGDDPFKLEMRVGKWQQKDGKRVFSEETDTNYALEQAWKRFLWKDNFTVRKNMDAMEALRVVEMSRVREGSVICREYPGYEYNDFGFAVDFLEEDRLQEQFNGISGKDSPWGAGNPIRGSVEFHPKYNFALGYWLLRRHPGEFFASGLMAPGGGAQYSALGQGGDARNWREPVPADQIIHFNNLRTRAEQDVGMTEMDACVLPLWRIHQYDKSLTLSSIASASKPWWVEEAVPTGLELPGELKEMMDNFRAQGGGIIAEDAPGGNAVAAQQGIGTPTQVIRPAAREKLPAGQVLKQADPRFPIEAAHEFRLDNERDVSVGTHGSYQQQTGDYQSLGFIAGLMSQSAFQRNMKVRQKTMIEDLRKLFKDWLKAAIMKGYFDRNFEAAVSDKISITRIDEFVGAAFFKGQNWPFVNPLVQAQALILLNESGHISRETVQDELPFGQPFDELVQELSSEKEKMDEAGLDYEKEEATEPGINHQGDLAPGQEKPGPSDGEPGAPASPSKGSRPRTRHVRGRIDDTTRFLIEQSNNGQH